MERTNAYSLLEFLDNSPCNFFATATIQRHLDDNGFHELNHPLLILLPVDTTSLLI